MDANLQSLNNDEQTHLFQTPQHYSPEEHEQYQALDQPHQQQYIDGSPEFYAATHLLEPKFNPVHNYVKNYVRGKLKTYKYTFHIHINRSVKSRWSTLTSSNQNASS